MSRFNFHDLQMYFTEIWRQEIWKLSTIMAGYTGQKLTKNLEKDKSLVGVEN